MKILPNQCRKTSKPVTDIGAIKPLIPKMIQLCNRPLGRYPSARALAHCQVDHDTPLRFFVMANGTVIINPIITFKTQLDTNNEGCYSYPHKEEVDVSRYRTIEVTYTTLTNNETKTITRKQTGMKAAIFQHEIDHFDKKHIYQK